MEQITPEQLTTLAEKFTVIAQAILAFRENHNLGDQDATLEEIQNELLDKSEQLATLAAIEAGQDAAEAITRLNGVTERIKNTVQNLDDVQKAINIGTAVLGVAIAVISLNPGQIIDSIGKLGTASGINI